MKEDCSWGFGCSARNQTWLSVPGRARRSEICKQPAYFSCRCDCVLAGHVFWSSGLGCSVEWEQGGWDGMICGIHSRCGEG